MARTIRAPLLHVGRIIFPRLAIDQLRRKLAHLCVARPSLFEVFALHFFRIKPKSKLIGVEPLPGKDDASMTFGEGESSAFHAAIEMSLVPIVLADPHQPDEPIIFANGAFCELTGYDKDEIVGRNCRFLQGPATDKKAVARIQSAVAARWHVTEELANYRKDGCLF